MSARAAARLEAMGFNHLYDYVDGKKDWLAAGLPTEGERSDRLRSGDLARPDPPTCRPDEKVQDIDSRSAWSGWGFCVVTDDDKVVHGLLSPGDIADSPGSARVEDVMQLGPTTIRPSRSMGSAVKRMDEIETDWVLVTTKLGELLGVLYREDAEAE